MSAIGTPFADHLPEPATVQVAGRSVRLSPWYGFEGAVLLGIAPSLWLRDPGWLEVARRAAEARGWRRFLVQGTSLAQRQALESAGWVLVDELYVLFRRTSLPMPSVPPTARGVELRRGRAADLAEVLEVDHRCFEPFWVMNEAAFREAMQATPRTRYRVLASGDDDRVVGYAIFGLGAGEGYLQRIAVDPRFQGRGLATRLIVDGLRWTKRWRARRVGVNTQRTNQTALRLYQHLGFVVESEGIAIYAWPGR
jgi:ribosomal protein S18 acetylase RimI-like enzyme